MKILVTGATGFVGRHVLSMLGDHEVFATTRRPIEASGDSGSSVTWITANLSEGLDTAKLPARMDGIIHLAQSERYREFPAGAPDVFRVNVESASRLMTWARSAGVTRATFASTGTVYEPFSGVMDEAAPVAPTGYYGASKLACEALTLPYQTAELAVAQMRIFFVYGPGQGNSMIARLMESVRTGQSVTLPSSGDGLTFVPTYVEDTARVMVQACVESWRGVWNLASPHAVTMRDLLQAIGDAAGRAPVIVRTEQAAPSPIVPDLKKLATRVDIGAFLTPRAGVARLLTGKQA